MLEKIFENLISFLTCLSPIICAWMAWKSNVSQKQTKEFIALQEKYNAEHAKVKKAEAEAQKKMFDAMHDEIQKLSDEVKKLSDKTVSGEEIKSSLDKLFNISNCNYEYSHSLNQLICAIGEVIEHSDLGDTGHIQVELERHRKKENEIHGKILKLVE